MRRREERCARPRCRAQAGVDDQTVGIDGNGMRPRFGEQQLRVGQRITGVLDPHLVAGREQHADRDVDCLLRARRRCGAEFSAALLPTGLLFTWVAWRRRQTRLQSPEAAASFHSGSQSFEAAHVTASAGPCCGA